MTELLQKQLHTLLIVCILIQTISGLSVRRKQRVRYSVSDPIRTNAGSGFLSILNAFDNVYTYTTDWFNQNKPQKQRSNPRSYNLGGGATSGVAGCKNCFLGLRVERREAMVVS